ncbi:hypothetical protein T484DRAFT_1758650 [Baffinella frigidus]|nr:hypothetical protein T484DRAFT_1758650 [Cryptophyta sp. CCMP2293]
MTDTEPKPGARKRTPTQHHDEQVSKKARGDGDTDEKLSDKPIVFGNVLDPSDAGRLKRVREESEVADNRAQRAMKDLQEAAVTQQDQKKAKIETKRIVLKKKEAATADKKAATAAKKAATDAKKVTDAAKKTKANDNASLKKQTHTFTKKDKQAQNRKLLDLFDGKQPSSAQPGLGRDLQSENPLDEQGSNADLPVVVEKIVVFASGLYNLATKTLQKAKERFNKLTTEELYSSMAEYKVGMTMPERVFTQLFLGDCGEDESNMAFEAMDKYKMTAPLDTSGDVTKIYAPSQKWTGRPLPPACFDSLMNLTTRKDALRTLRSQVFSYPK